MDYLVLCFALFVGLFSIVVLWCCIQPYASPMSETQLDAWQCENWRSEGKTEEDIKALCDIFDMVYDPP